MTKTFRQHSRILLGVILLALPTGLRAAFQDSDWGARPAGLAGAFSALADDANAPAYNPAAVSRIQQTEATLTYAQLFSGLKLYAGNDTTSLGLGYLSFVPKPFMPFGNLGFYIANFDSKGLYQENTYAVSWGSRLSQINAALPSNLALGLNLKYLEHGYTLDSLTNSDPVFQNGHRKGAVGMDVGLQWEALPTVLPGFRVAAVGKNVNEPNVGLAQKDRVPSEFHLGMALDSPTYRMLTPSIEWTSRNGQQRWMGGAESWLLNRTLGLRLGLNSREFGGGLSYRFRASNFLALQIDYTLLWPLYVENTSGSHRVSLTARFGSAPMPKTQGVYEFKKGEWVNSSPENKAN
jgi:hypothetical protein